VTKRAKRYTECDLQPSSPVDKSSVYSGLMSLARLIYPAYLPRYVSRCWLSRPVPKLLGMGYFLLDSL